MRIAIDTETTGLPGADPVYITQLAVVTPDKATTYLLKIPKDAVYSAEAEGITGITREQLDAGGKDPKVIFGALAKKLATDWRDAEFIAHNVEFDRARLAESMAEYVGFEAAKLVNGLDWKCTLKASRRIWRGRGNKLGQVCERLGITFDEAEAHDATYDARKALEVYEAIKAGKHKQQQAETAKPKPLKAEVVRDIVKPRDIKVPAVNLDATPLVAAAKRVAEDLTPYVEQAQSWAGALEVSDDESEAAATNAIGALRKAIKKADQHRKALTDQLGPPKREIDAAFREIKRPLEAAAKAAQAKIDAHAQAEYQRKRKAEAEAQAAALKAAKAGEDVEIPTEAEPVKVETDNATSRVVVTYAVDLVEDESKVEREFLSPDMAKAQRFADAFVTQAGGELDEAALKTLRGKLPGFRVSERVEKRIRRRS